MKVSVIIPSRLRAVQLIERVNILLHTVQGRDVEVVIVVDEDADCLRLVIAEMQANALWQPNAFAGDLPNPRILLVSNYQRLGPIGSWNAGLGCATGNAIVMAADDVIFHDGWLEAALIALATLTEAEGLVALNDCSGRSDLRPFRSDTHAGRHFMPHFLVTRNFIVQAMGGVLCIPAYSNYYTDVEVCARAQAVGRYVYAENSRVEHTHPALWNANMDEMYQTGDAQERDLATFLLREAKGFPDDFDPIIKTTTDKAAPVDPKPSISHPSQIKPDLARKVSVILPSLGRPAQLVKCVDQLLLSLYTELADGLKLEVVIVIDEDEESREAVEDEIEKDFLWTAHVKLLYRPSSRGPMVAWNDGLKESTGEIIVLGADDLWFTDGWLTYALLALDTLPDSDGLVGLNDASGVAREFATHWLCTRRWISREQNGCLVVPLYQRQFIDPEACARAQISRHYVYAVRAVVEHRHYLWGKAPFDETYARHTPEVYEEDQKLYAERMKAGFPDDFPPAIETPRVFWAVPRERFCFAEAAIALENVARHCDALGYIAIQAKYAATDTAREGFTRKFLELSKNPDDVLVMLDNDHDHPEDVVERLANCGNAGVVGALCRRRGDELDALIFKRNEVTGRMDRIVKWPEGELIQVDMVGGGAIAIRRWVFDKLREKFDIKYWFWQYNYDTNCSDRPGEEVRFMRMCEEVGIPVACDTSTISPHLITVTVEKIIAVAEAAGRMEDWKKVL